MLKNQRLDCKILVTSREVPFTRYSTACELHPLDHDDAVALFHHFAQLNNMPDQDLVHEVLSLQSNLIYHTNETEIYVSLLCSIFYYVIL
jgi:hypothetical protein